MPNMLKNKLFYLDENNNEASYNSCPKDGNYVERHLELNDDDFLIIPNGGSGDCMFKAVSQAVHNGDESKHKEIRSKLVDYIINQRWDKFSESIEVQHINGNNLLQRQWAKNKKQTYKMYMTMAGTMGSLTELMAAGELFKYNFATIQEYCSNTGRTYRVENCLLIDDTGDFHHFYFTGDFDSGHWEFIKSSTNIQIDDGTYHGRHKTLINNEEISLEEWLVRESFNKNDLDLLKIPTDREQYINQIGPDPFGLTSLNYNRDNTVNLNGVTFAITNIQSTDLFSVLAYECVKNEELAFETEEILMKHRSSYFEEINYKLMTQPLSHNFTVDAIKYSAFPCKGNIQDLISAADLYSFSFILFMKFGDEVGEDVHECKFTHVDRWGGESDRVVHFFMRLVPIHEDSDEHIAKWWCLIPHDKNNSRVHTATEIDSLTKFRKDIVTPTKTKKRVPTPTVDYSHDDISTRESVASAPPMITNASRRMSKLDMRLPKSPMISKTSSRASTPRPQLLSQTDRMREVENLRAALELQAAHTIRESPFENTKRTPPPPTPPPLVHEEREELLHFSSDEGIVKECEKIFGSEPLSENISAIAPRKQLTTQNSPALLVKKAVKEKLKPATDLDLLLHPDRVKTVVKVSDTQNSGKEITYRGNGYIGASEVLTDLRSQGLIKLTNITLPESPRPRSSVQHWVQQACTPINNALDQKFTIYRQETDDPCVDANLNFNLFPIQTNADELIPDDASEISFEKFGPGAFQHTTPPDDMRQSREKLMTPTEFLTEMQNAPSRFRHNRIRVGPDMVDISQQFVARRTNYRNDVRVHKHSKYDYHSNQRSHTCTSRLKSIMAWISELFQRTLHKSKEGLRSRYDRYRKSRSSTTVPVARDGYQAPMYMYNHSQ